MKTLYRVTFALIAVLVIAFVIILIVQPAPEAENEVPTAPTTAPTEAAETLPEETEPPVPPANIYLPTDFVYNEQGLLTGTKYPFLTGIDVSEYQDITDWEALRDYGIQFVMVRAGFRGYGEAGNLVEDSMAREYMEQAHAAGLKVGVYFFSQATTVEEAIEEAEMTLSIVEGQNIELPIAFDWEYIGDYARTADTDKETVTACTKAFCNTIASAGYLTMFYSNQNSGDSHFDLVELQKYPMWLAMYDMPMTYPHRMYMWQYTASAEIPGIEGYMDLNIYLPYSPHTR